MSRIYKPENVILRSNTEIYTNQKLLIVGDSPIEETIREILETDFSVDNEKTIVRYISGPDYDDDYFNDWSDDDFESDEHFDEYGDSGIYTVDIIIFHEVVGDIELIGF